MFDAEYVEQLVRFSYKIGNQEIRTYLKYTKKDSTLHITLINCCSSTANRICKKGYRRCMNGRCIGHQFWCDGTDDCGDHSDELPCNSKSFLSILQLQLIGKSLSVWWMRKQKPCQTCVAGIISCATVLPTQHCNVFVYLIKLPVILMTP